MIDKKIIVLVLLFFSVLTTNAQGRKSTINVAGIELIFVKGGTFIMGGCSSEEQFCSDDMKLAHTVTLSDYYIGKYEVTQAQWDEIVGTSPSKNKKCSTCPVNNISWDYVQDYINHLNKVTGKKFRLPTEAEWEYAARGGILSQGYVYAGSHNIDEVAWYLDNSFNGVDFEISKVGQKKPNELGIYDMSGNVWEWCSDWYGEDYYKNSPILNPKGPKSGKKHIVRGGGIFPWSYCVTDRGAEASIFRDEFGGFRLVLEIEE